MKAKLLLVGALVGLIAVSFLLRRESHPEEYIEKEQPPSPASKKLPDRATLRPGKIASVKTNRGTFKIVVYDTDMPTTADNFYDLVIRRFYDGLKFHRVDDMVVQGGDPKGDGTGGFGRTIKLEIKEGLGFERPYMVGMARSSDPNSASSQFFVTKRPAPHLTGQYAAFGRVFEGQEVIGKLRKGDVIRQITLAEPTVEERAALARMDKSALIPVPPASKLPVKKK